MTRATVRPSWIVLIAVVITGLGLGVAAWLLDAGAMSVPLSELEAMYATPESRFLDVDGVRLHYMDQGAGPAVLLLHASFMHLRTWDRMAATLAEQHRVVRLDLLISGLTGPDPRDDYSMDRNRALTLGLMDRLGIDDFSVVGTSSGGIIAFNLAAAHAGRVKRLVLINSAGMPRSAATDPNRRARRGGLANWVQARYMTRRAVRRTLDMNFVEPHEPPEWLVDMNYDMWRRAGRREAMAMQLRNFRTGDPQATLAQVKAPTLILWGLENATVMHLEADVFQHWLVNAPTYLKKYTGVGHYLYLEIPDQAQTDIGDFLSGRLDSQLVSIERRVGPGAF
ncbi:MAG: alpha/beta hydrolase [Gammaproteobacteria bacterium]|nr:alpha/beta hydrolase [Gammaproteobacteria bacterium]